MLSSIQSVWRTRGSKCTYSSAYRCYEFLVREFDTQYTITSFVCLCCTSLAIKDASKEQSIYMSRPEQRTRHTSHRVRFWVEFAALDMTSWTLFNESKNDRDHTDIKPPPVDLSHKTRHPRSLIIHKMFQRYFGRIVRHRSSPTGHQNQLTGLWEPVRMKIIRFRLSKAEKHSLFLMLFCMNTAAENTDMRSTGVFF